MNGCLLMKICAILLIALIAIWMVSFFHAKDLYYPPDNKNYWNIIYDSYELLFSNGLSSAIITFLAVVFFATIGSIYLHFTTNNWYENNFEKLNNYSRILKDKNNDQLVVAIELGLMKKIDLLIRDEVVAKRYKEYLEVKKIVEYLRSLNRELYEAKFENGQLQLVQTSPDRSSPIDDRRFMEILENSIESGKNIYFGIRSYPLPSHELFEIRRVDEKQLEFFSPSELILIDREKIKTLLSSEFFESIWSGTQIHMR